MSNAYKVIHASLIRSVAILRVVADGETESEKGSSPFTVVGDPEKKLVFRSGRPVYDEEGRLQKERIFIMEAPEFDIEGIVGKIITNTPIVLMD